ncbi:sigma-54-dependent Fis family transcriptional regulator [Exilibacterium tricleocarpae]|uniref:Sigma-54-dependent Fis family transcriptional regulator n=2 Tax=Exilibacterium tricleocarpae TaxID=2591008 RepID=A0A545TZS9_9GAMM|nr:sigma-54-dependent Fis family transcriptional regulator [Exilibacterium tricleocarpae]
MIGSAQAFVDILKTIQRCAKVDVPVLINGETGTGKELAARALHYAGPRRAGPFQALNCGAIPDLLVENELFGHVRGAYTDARGTQPGLVELASGGTLFLDEVDALSYKAQGALLRFIQDGTYRELGGGTDKRADVRVVSASNKSLEALARAGKFRQDLMYRLNTLIVDMPSLRERREDIPALVTYFLQASEKEFSLGSKHFHPQSITDIISYGWPGNIRELENFVRRAYLLTDGQVIFQSPDKSPDHCSNLSPAGDGPARRCNGAQQAIVPFSDAKRLAVDYFESSYIAQLLRTTGGNLSRAAQLAGKERRAFSRLVKKHGIIRSDF